MRPPEPLSDAIVVLRSLEEGDRAAALETMRDPLVRRWLSMPPDPDDTDFDALMRTVEEGRAAGDRFDFQVTVDGGRAVGAVVGSRRARDNWELAYLAGERGRGRGGPARATSDESSERYGRGAGRLAPRRFCARMAPDAVPVASRGAELKPPRRLTDGVVVLRELEERDREPVLETMRDPLVAHWLNMPPNPGDADFDALVATIREGRASGERIDFGVCASPEGVSVGAVIASRRQRDNWELAYLAGRHARGRGLMARGVRLVCDWLFCEGVGRLELRTMVANEPSQRLAERCGFVREGVERKSIWLHGERHDAVVYSLLPGDPR